MKLPVGTFNLNNLFSRFNYEAEVAELPAEEGVINSPTTFPVADPTAHRFRTIAVVSSWASRLPLCMELDSAGCAAGFRKKQKRDESGSRVNRRLVLV